MAIYGIRATPDILRSIDSATFTGSYQSVGTALTKPIRIVKFVNASTVDVTISWDGINDNDIVPTGSFSLYDFTSNEAYEDGFFVPENTQFYVKAAAGTGLFYMVCIGAET